MTCLWAEKKSPGDRCYVDELAAAKQMKRIGMPHLANRTLSLSSLPHSQLFPGSTAKCKGSSLCSESVSGITAGGGKTRHQGVSPRREEGNWTQTDWYYRRYDNCSHFSFLTCELSWHLKLKGWLSLKYPAHNLGQWSPWFPTCQSTNIHDVFAS